MTGSFGGLLTPYDRLALVRRLSVPCIGAECSFRSVGRVVLAATLFAHASAALRVHGPARCAWFRPGARRPAWRDDAHRRAQRERFS